MFQQPEGIEPGVYYDLSAEDYHKDPALSSSGLKLLLKNPYKYWISSPLNPKRVALDTVTLKNSRAFHTMLLEPHKFHEEFAIKESCKTTKLEGHVGRGDYDDMVKAAQTIRDDKLISNLISGGKAEVSIFWRDEQTGIMCRVRFDYLRSRIGFDYKTTTDVSMEKLGYAIAEYGYDVSAAMYIEGLKNAGLYGEDHLGFVLLFQEKVEPYLYEAVRLSDDIMNIGYNSFRHGLDIYRENIEKYGADKWLRPSDGVKDIGMEYMPYKYKQ